MRPSIPEVTLVVDALRAAVLQRKAECLVRWRVYPSDAASL